MTIRKAFSIIASKGHETQWTDRMTTVAQTETPGYRLQQVGHGTTVLNPGGTHAKETAEQDGYPTANSALAALLDHLARELAREYIRLMEDAFRTHSRQS